jgi:hypothetical protein
MNEKYDWKLGLCSQYSDQGMGWTIWGTNIGRATDIFLLQNIETNSGAYPASCFIGTKISFPE